MSLFGKTLCVVIVVTALAAFTSYLLLGTRHASARRLGVYLALFGAAILTAVGRDLGRLAVAGQPADGVILSFAPGNKVSHPVVRFTAADGREVQFKCRQGMSRRVYEVGQSVPVYYLESDPPFAVVATGWSLWLPLSAGTITGLVPLVGGVWLVRRAVR